MSAACTRSMRRWRSRTRGTSTPDAAKASRSGSCRRLRSSPAIPRTRTSSSSRRSPRSTGTQRSTRSPTVSPTSDPAPGVITDEGRLPTIADGCLLLSHRLSEWMSNAPTMEEDIALGNIALDLLGQARGLLQLVGDEDQLAYFREPQEFRNPLICELPNGDFAFTLLRQLFVDTWLAPVGPRLAPTWSDERVRGVAEKAIKENAYHRRHSSSWVIRLGDGTDESRRRMHA